MPDAAWHLAKAARFEAFLDAASVTETQHPEWTVIAHFYTVLHYVETVKTSSVRSASTLKSGRGCAGHYVSSWRGVRSGRP